MNWRELAKRARDRAETDEALSPSREERLALAIEAVVLYAKGYAEVSDLAERSILSEREMGLVLRTQMPQINQILGTNYAYMPSSYTPSGSGPFGRYHSSRGRYNKPRIVNRGDEGEEGLRLIRDRIAKERARASKNRPQTWDLSVLPITREELSGMSEEKRLEVVRDSINRAADLLSAISVAFKSDLGEIKAASLRAMAVELERKAK